MSRRFPCFLEAYLEYAADGFVPPQFNLWSALSVVAGALERRVWLPWNDTYAYHPNIYVLLVSMPGDGKSVALNRAVGLLQEVNRKTSTLNIMPNQVTEAKFIELMGHGRSFTDKSSGKELQIFQNAGYYWASEASNSLRNIFGDFIACLTDFYDCPAVWERATKKDGKKIALKNVCMNLLAGSTFDYLGKLVNDENIMGGFASRLIYVVSKNKIVVPQEFQLGGINQEEQEARQQYRAALVQDLTAISQMTGPFKADRDFGKAWESWYPDFERGRRAIQSEKVQSILARANTNILKVAMVLSASESDDRQLKLKHWERAHEMVMSVQDQTPAVFREARANSSERTPGNLVQSLLFRIDTEPGITRDSLISKLAFTGHKPHEINAVLDALMRGHQIGTTSGIAGRGIGLKLLCDPNNNL